MDTGVKREGGLPEYADPPVVEVAASVQFKNVRQLDAARLGLLWSRFRDEYPGTEQHPPLPLSVEIFGPTRRVGLSVEPAFPTPRLWFLSADGTRLVQVQSNRMVVNWRQLETATRYERFSRVRDMLTASLAQLEAFLEAESLGALIPEQVELTYVNHIHAGASGSPRVPLSRFISFWKDEGEQWRFGSAEEASFRTQYLVQRPNGAKARLYAELDSGYAGGTRTPIYVLNLVARGAPDTPTLGGAVGFLDAAHELIVNAFTDLTTQDAHSLWRRSR